MGSMLKSASLSKLPVSQAALRGFPVISARTLLSARRNFPRNFPFALSHPRPLPSIHSPEQASTAPRFKTVRNRLFISPFLASGMVAGSGAPYSEAHAARAATVVASAAAEGSGSAVRADSADAAVGGASAAPQAAVAPALLRRLEDLQWESTFVDELPGDPIEENHVRMVRGACYSLVRPSLKLVDPQVVAASAASAELIGLDPSEFDRPEFASVFAGGLMLKGSKPFAQCYGGHQFGSWAGQLGDGRAISLGEVVLGEAPSGSSSNQQQHQQQSWEVQLKGVGKTPYSRSADGRAVLRSSIREFLCSEAMGALGVPTTRAVSVVTTGEKVLRDMFYNGNARFEPGAAVCRVAPSFLRFGSFQLHASRGGLDKQLVRVLADYTVRHHYQHLEGLPEPEVQVREAGEAEEEEGDADAVDVTKNKYAAWFAEVAERTGTLVAAWQSVGFTHGVLNTDNMSILGLTIDYGPFGFLDAFDPAFTPNTSDLPGRRYCFRQQPDIGLWNIVQLANTLVTAGLVGMAEAQHCVARYADTFLSSYQQRMASKLGLPDYHKDLTQALLQLMAKHGDDFTNTFRALAHVTTGSSDAAGGAAARAGAVGAGAAALPSDEALLAPMLGVLGLEGKGASDKAREWTEWLRRYANTLRASGVYDAARLAAMDACNPAYVLRNYQCQLAIEAAEQGDYSVTRRLLEVLQRPFEERKGLEEFAKPPPDWAKKPGVCMLSCSS